jgi:tRNA (cmo5U34)-methyltransferase
MGVAAHLGIALGDYDRRIRTFIPDYGRMLAIAARALDAAISREARTILDLGIGTGALAARCLEVRPRAKVIGIDSDGAMLELARQRLGERAALLTGSFERVALPRCDAIVASLALHHIPTPRRRAAAFRRFHRALRPGGVLLSADCYLSSSPALRRADRLEWLGHLEQTYTPSEALALLRSWAKEDFYVTLDEELRLLSRAGFRPDVVGRNGCFAVICASR